MKGTIVRVTDKGFGFISPEGEDKDVFFHAKDLMDYEFNDLKGDEAVTFDVSEGPKGPAATNVQVVSDDAAPADDSADEATEEAA